jgi:NAD(P) transhydrogenase subunit alpha
VRAFDTRPVVKEQVQSMGAEFLEIKDAEDGTGEGGYAKEVSKTFLEKEMALFLAQAKECDIIITTALIPGKPAPRLITREMVEAMHEGSVIVDMAAEQGGNCEVTKPAEVSKHKGVTIIGLTDLPSRMANQSSQLYGNNLAHLLEDMGGAPGYKVDHADEVVRGALVLEKGELRWPAPKKEAAPPRHESRPHAAPPVGSPAGGPPKPSEVAQNGNQSRSKNGRSGGHGKGAHGGDGKSGRSSLGLAVAGLALLGMGLGAPASFLSHLTVFVLAIFVGWQVIWNVTPALHTPLMSVTNAVSGIIIIGGLLQLEAPPGAATTTLGLVAVLVATINIAGGFLVTQRMLKMFRK